jgi:apolipoprotein N-acyltransferase
MSMESGADGSPFVAGVAALLLTAALVWFGTGLAPWWPLIWLAPLPVLLFAVRAPWTGAVLAASLAWLLGCLNWWHYFHDVLHAPATVFLLFAIEALVFALAVLLFRALLRRRAHWSALLAFPAAWVSFEYLLNLTSLHGTFGSLSYSQLGFLPLLQVASLTGPWGVSFAPLLFSTTLATAWQLRGRRSTPWRVLGAGLGAIGLVLLFGAWRLAQPAVGPIVKVGLVASDAPQYRGVVDEGPPTARMFAD